MCSSNSKTFHRSGPCSHGLHPFWKVFFQVYFSFFHVSSRLSYMLLPVYLLTTHTGGCGMWRNSWYSNEFTRWVIWVNLIWNKVRFAFRTQPVDSAIFSSRGSPRGWSLKSVTVWQQARPESRCPWGRSLGSGTISEKPSGPPSITPHTSSPSSVRVPVWKNKGPFITEELNFYFPLLNKTNFHPANMISHMPLIYKWTILNHITKTQKIQRMQTHRRVDNNILPFSPCRSRRLRACHWRWCEVGWCRRCPGSSAFPVHRWCQWWWLQAELEAPQWSRHPEPGWSSPSRWSGHTPRWKWASQIIS